MSRKPRLKIILVSVAAIIVAFLVMVALQPSDFRVSRSAAIAVPPAESMKAIAKGTAGK